ncbi:MAG: hypothetical protein AB8H47_31595 [Bacteroidia bacterium]
MSKEKSKAGKPGKKVAAKSLKEKREAKRLKKSGGASPIAT